MITGLNNLSYEVWPDILGLRSLKERRNRADLLKLFKMYVGVSSVRFDSIFELSTNRNTREHTLKFAKHRSQLDIGKYFFSERDVNRWNSLKQYCRQKSFKN